MYGYIYKTTNLITNKIYIGQKHSNKFLGENYLGSGKRLREAILKYGKANFKVELLEEIEFKVLMDEREIYWINYYNSTNKDIGYNLSEGGNVNRTMRGENNPFYGKHHSEETKQKWKISRHYKKGPENKNYGRMLTDEQKQKISQANKGKINTPEQIEKWKRTRKLNNKKVSSETKLKISIAKKGKTTKAKGCIYITNDITSKRVPEKEVQTYINQGWRRGRKKFAQQACENISKGHRGHLAGNKNTKWMNNGKQNKCIRLDEIEYYLSIGWQLGMKPKIK